MRLHRLVVPVLGICALAAPVAAQESLSFWVGAGRPWGDTSRVLLKTSDLYAGVQLGVPVIPFAVRVEGRVAALDYKNAPRSLVANAVIPLRMPGLQPYLIGGYGAYSYGRTEEVRGYNYGAGVRVGMGRTGVFGEVRQHDPLKRRLVTLGVTF